MATVTFIKYASQSAAVLGSVAAYVSQEEKTQAENGRQLVSGQNCSPFLASREFLATRNMHRKQSPIFFYHYVQSFHPDEPVTGELAHEIANAFAARAWPESEVLIATHVDREHVHSHFIVNSVCYDSGKMLRQGPNTLAALRPISDELCLTYHLSVLPKQQKVKNRGAQNVSPREYRAAAKGQSWKFRLMNTIDDCMRFAYDREEFLALMRSEGYDVRWEDGRQTITYTTPTGMKCRDDRLHDVKYRKENMAHELEIRQRLHTGGAKTAKRSAADKEPKRHVAGGRGSAAKHAGGDDRVSAADRGAADDPLLSRRAAGAAEQHDPDGGTAGTGWEAERAALFSPAPQAHLAASVAAAAAHPYVSGGVLSLAAGIALAAGLMGDNAVETPVKDATSLPQPRRRKRKQGLGQEEDDQSTGFSMTMK